MTLTGKEIQAQIDADGGDLARVKDLVPWAKNPRINDIAAKMLAEFISQRGWGSALLVQRGSNRIIGGHTRLKAAKKLGLDRVPVRYVTCDDRTADALAMADNKLGEVAEWNSPGVAEILSQFGLEEAEAMGWDSAALEQLAKDVESFGPLEPKEVVEDEVPEPTKTPVTKPGDVWKLGPHTLLCGSCVDLPAEPGSAAIMVTDPPYGVSYAEKNKFLNAISSGDRIQTPIENDHHAPEEMSRLWTGWFSSLRPKMRDGGAYYVTGPQRGDLLLLLLLALRDSGFPLRHMLVWKKNNHVLGRSDYHYKHEPILYGWVDGAAHHAVKNRSETSVWEIDRPQKSDIHPTMKPVELYARAYRNSTSTGELAIEPFAGSGTGFVAAEQTGRVCIGSEMSPAYCDVIVERWQSLTGGKAERTSV